MSKQKLNELGIDLPNLPTTAVGSYPKPDYLKEARTKYKNGDISDGELQELEEKATRFWIDRQEELDIDVVVDGEMYRGDMVAYFADHMPGFDQGGLVRSYGNRYYYKPIIKDEVSWPGPITVDRWEFASSLTDRPVKAILTGPYTIMDWSFNEHYADREATALALADVIRKEVEALVDAGAKIIQVDEPATSVRPEEMPVVIDALNRVTQDLDAYFVTHICYGVFEQIYPEMLNMPVDNFDLELSNSDLDLVEKFKEDPFTKDISFGVVDVHDHRIESKDVVHERIREAKNVIDEDQLWIDPDCGMKTRTEQETTDKLDVLVSATKQER
jgi:5-methyltetrahydropteroyltriglutamate--homocysteine methyltransferase